MQEQGAFLIVQPSREGFGGYTVPEMILAEGFWTFPKGGRREPTRYATHASAEAALASLRASKACGSSFASIRSEG